MVSLFCWNGNPIIPPIRKWVKLMEKMAAIPILQPLATSLTSVHLSAPRPVPPRTPFCAPPALEPGSSYNGVQQIAEWTNHWFVEGICWEAC